MSILGKFLSAGSGGLVSQAIGLMCLPLLARLYSPDIFAPWLVAQATAMLVGGTSGLRYELAVVIEPDDKDAGALFWLTMVIGLSLSVIVAVALVLFSPHRMPPGQPGQMMSASIPVMTGCWMIVVALSQPLQGWCLRRGAFARQSTALAVGAVVSNLLQLSFGVTSGMETTGLIAGSLIGQIISLLILYRVCAHDGPGSFSNARSNLRRVAKTHRNFPLFTSLYTFATVARERASILLLGNYVSSSSIGFYGQAWRLMNVPVGLTSSAIRPVIFNAAAREGLPQQEARVAAIFLILTLMSAPWIPLLWRWPEEIFGCVLGDRWRAAGPIAAVLAFPMLLHALNNWLDRIFDLLGRQKLSLALELISTSTSLLALVIVLMVGGSLLEAVFAQALVLTMNYLAYVVVVYRIAGYKIGPLLRTLTVLVAICVIGYAIILILSQFLPAPIASGCYVMLSVTFLSVTCVVARRSRWW